LKLEVPDERTVTVSPHYLVMTKLTSRVKDWTMLRAIVLCVLTASVLSPRALAVDIDQARITVLHTASGVRFGVLGQKAATPSPTLFVFANDIEGTLEPDNFNMVGHLLAKKGWLSVSLDLPCHGKNLLSGEAAGSLECWRKRLESGTNFMPGFLANVSEVLDYLVQHGYTDVNRVAACGTSRGGFVALHFAAVESRVRAVAAFAPVTDLLALREFAGIEQDSPSVLRMVKSLALVNSAEKLAGRPIWICIGNYDQRVNTDYAIAFTRRVVEASVAEDKPPNVEIRVLPPDGYQVRVHDNGHSVPVPAAHPEAAEWILARMGGAK
jgi:dienelactone hydrolase